LGHGNKVTEGLSKLNNEELHNMSSSSNITLIKSRKIKWVDIYSTGERRNAYNMLIVKFKENSPLG
jgi:hypothetical protein